MPLRRKNPFTKTGPLMDQSVPETACACIRVCVCVIGGLDFQKGVWLGKNKQTNKQEEVYRFPFV